MVCLLFVLTSTFSFAQTIPNRVTKVVSPASPFLPNENALLDFSKRLEEALTCKESFKKTEFQTCFFSLNETKAYIQFLEEQKYPNINEKASPIFHNMTIDARKELANYASDNVAFVKILGTKQSYGDAEAMKRVVAHVNMHMHSGEIRSIKLLLLDFNGVYKIMTIDN
jgi:hypothetical protein